MIEVCKYTNAFIKKINAPILSSTEYDMLNEFRIKYLLNLITSGSCCTKKYSIRGALGRFDNEVIRVKLKVTEC